MKKSAIIAGLFVICAFISCKKEDKAQETKEVKVEKTDAFTVSLDIISTKDVDLILYYKDGSNEWFEDSKAIWQGAKANPASQTVVFTFPEEATPNDLRLDIGRNDLAENVDVIIKNVKFEFLGRETQITGDQFGMFFKPNQYISFNEATKVYTCSKSENGSYDGFFETKPEFYTYLYNFVMGN